MIIILIKLKAILIAIKTKPLHLYIFLSLQAAFYHIPYYHAKHFRIL